MTEKHPGRVAQGHSLAALIKKRKEETLRNKEQPTEKSNDTYIYGVGILAALAKGVCVFFPYNTSQAVYKKQVNEKQHQPPK